MICAQLSKAYGCAMTFEILCPCGQKLLAQEKHVGRRTACPTCKAELLIVGPDTATDNEATSTLGNAFIRSIRERFETALRRIEHDVPVLIQSKGTLAGRSLFREAVREIERIHNSLLSVYKMVMEERVLAHGFGLASKMAWSHQFFYIQDRKPDSFGVYVPGITADDLFNFDEGDVDFPTDEQLVNDQGVRRFADFVTSQGLLRRHPPLNAAVISEIEYLFRVLELELSCDWMPDSALHAMLGTRFS